VGPGGGGGAFGGGAWAALVRVLTPALVVPGAPAREEGPKDEEPAAKEAPRGVGAGGAVVRGGPRRALCWRAASACPQVCFLRRK
uniref:hypothetical protein n=1 Tax=Nocardia abscessus TaxID=120957 RepID=UPI0024551A0B